MARDFNNFLLLDIAQDKENVYELAGGVIPATAELLDVELGLEPNSEALGNLVGKLGKNKALRDNEEVTAIDTKTAVELVEESGVQEELNRSLWTPSIAANGVEAVVVTGGVANWQDRTAKLISGRVEPSTLIILAASTRVMDLGTEKANPNIEQFFETHGYYPTEADYVDEVIAPAISSSHSNVHWERAIYEGAENGDDIAELVVAANPQLVDQRVGFARVANAGVQLAVQMRSAAMKLSEGFDDNPENPQVFVLTDSFPLATTEEQESHPADYQKAITALRQVALTAKMLHETAGGE